MEKENKEMLAKAAEELKPNTEFAEWYDKISDYIEQDVAEHVFKAYKKGCEEYCFRAWNAEDKYNKLCIKVCEQFI